MRRKAWNYLHMVTEGVASGEVVVCGYYYLSLTLTRRIDAPGTGERGGAIMSEQIWPY